MSDSFELLGIPRQAAIDLEALEKRFHALSKETHPDVDSGDSGRFEAVNSAHGTLRTVSSRLKHLRKLEFPDRDEEKSAAMDPGLMDLFAELGPAVQRAEAVSKEIKGAQSALAKALLADSVWEAREALEEMGNEVADRLRKQASELEEIDTQIERGEREKALRLLDRNYQTAAFLEKWQAQIREKLMGLMG